MSYEVVRSFFKSNELTNIEVRHSNPNLIVELEGEDVSVELPGEVYVDGEKYDGQWLPGVEASSENLSEIDFDTFKELPQFLFSSTETEDIRLVGMANNHVFQDERF